MKTSEARYISSLFGSPEFADAVWLRREAWVGKTPEAGRPRRRLE
jgi:hypothetical protein